VAYETCPKCGAEKHQLMACSKCGFSRRQQDSIDHRVSTAPTSIPANPERSRLAPVSPRAKPSGKGRAELPDVPPPFTEFDPKSRKLTVYIDETWPKGNETGVIAGLVWNGDGPNTEKLPKIRPHIWECLDFEQQATRALTDVYAASDCFPFIMPVRATAGRNPGAEYDEYVGLALQLLLGWVLPTVGCREQLAELDDEGVTVID
jgi:hypothetical protein